MNKEQNEFNKALSILLNDACNKMLDKASEVILEQLASSGIFKADDEDSVIAMKVSIFSVMVHASEAKVMELSKKLPGLLGRLEEEETDPETKQAFKELKEEIKSITDNKDTKEFSLSSWNPTKVDA